MSTNNAETKWRDAAEEGADKVLEFFRAPRETRDEKAADVGLRSGSNYARIYSARTNRVAVVVKTLRDAGATPEDMRRLAEDLTGIAPIPALPIARERSDKASKAGKRSRRKNQEVA